MVGRGLAVLLLALTVAALAVTFLPGLLGYQRYVLVGGSMEPAIHKGSLIFDEVVPVADLRAGDIITYVPPGSHHPVTHRLVEARRGGHGGRVFRTKGDANQLRDLAPFRLDRATQARFAFSIPVLGWAFILLGSATARFLLLALPALLLVATMLAGLWREGGRLVRERDAATGPG